MYGDIERQQHRRSWWPWMAATIAALFLVLVTGCASGRGSSSSVPDGWPLAKHYSVTSEFGPRKDPRAGAWRKHTGVDLSAPKGTPVLATAPGRVVFGGRDRGGYGKLVKLDHGNGIQTWYAHLSRRAVRQGERVHRGQQVGRVGNTGRTTGSHLHYEVRLHGQAVDPRGYLGERRTVASART
jgi:murein DD-endopeptidase MepM/ murein hydrolase activator NlpD